MGSSSPREEDIRLSRGEGVVKPYYKQIKEWSRPGVIGIRRPRNAVEWSGY